MDWINCGKARVVSGGYVAEALDAGERVREVRQDVGRDGYVTWRLVIVQTPVLALVDRVASLACMAIDAAVSRLAPKATEGTEP